VPFLQTLRYPESGLRGCRDIVSFNRRGYEAHVRCGHDAMRAEVTFGIRSNGKLLVATLHRARECCGRSTDRACVSEKINARLGSYTYASHPSEHSCGLRVRSVVETTFCRSGTDASWVF
jgi:hypothetical protein